MDDHVATADIEIGASPAHVWKALTDPEQIRQHMFDSQVETDWQQGTWEMMLTDLKEVVERDWVATSCPRRRRGE